jgi:general nucleoside transport system permease protein
VSRGAALMRRRIAGLRTIVWLELLLAFAALSVLKDLAGVPDLLSRGAAGASLRFTAPILLAGMGALWAERSGVINIALEGAMITGTWFGAWAGITFGPEAGVAIGLVAGAVFGLGLGVLTVGFGVDQAMAGLALNLLAAGVTRFLSSLAFEGAGGGSITRSPQVPALPEVSLPLAATVLEPVAAAGVPVLSDAASLLLGFTTNLSVLTILAFATVPATAWILWHTRLGLRIRFAGEAPDAEDALGVSPNVHRYLALAVSGALGSLGGVYLVMVASSNYSEGQTAGRGFIGMATVIFGNWQAIPTALGAYLFGFTDALRTRQETTINALLVVGGLVLLGIAVLRLRDRRRRSAAVYAGLAAACLGWFTVVGVVPSELVAFAPQITTLVVLALARQDLRPPAAVGLPYRRGEQT